jgi:hypothetical protein
LKELLNMLSNLCVFSGANLIRRAFKFFFQSLLKIIHNENNFRIKYLKRKHYSKILIIHKFLLIIYNQVKKGIHLECIYLFEKLFFS